MKKKNTMSKATDERTRASRVRVNALVIGKVVNRNCLEVLDGLPDNCCDVFTDPPYNVGKDYGPVDDSMPEEEYKSWIADVLTELKRVANTLVVYVPHKWNLLYWNILGTEFKEIVLPYNPSGPIRGSYVNQYNKLLTNARPAEKVKNVWDNMPQPGHGWFFREETYDYDGYTSEAITYKAIMKLMDSDIVFDPFMGTGTTAVAALKAGKEFAGCELNPNVIPIAERRIKEFKQQTTLAL